MAAADRAGDPEARDRLRRLCRLARRDQLGRLEVRTALSRAATDKGLPVHPGSRPRNRRLERAAALREALPGRPRSARQGRRTGEAPQGRPYAEWDKSIRLIDEPFVGLRSMREEEADRFFGRDAEVEELVEKFRKLRLVAIVADSGTGKSSLAEAGFAPNFRGGALADPSRSEPDDRVWHVVSMRPGANPEEGLKTGVSEAAEKLGLTGTTSARACANGSRSTIRARPPSRCNATCRRKRPRRC